MPAPGSDGDVLLINRRCTSLPLTQAVLCFASKYGLSGSGHRCWDHAAVVLRDQSSGVPYVLEGDTSGVRLRSYEERLMQGQDHQVACVNTRPIYPAPHTRSWHPCLDRRRAG